MTADCARRAPPNSTKTNKWARWVLLIGDKGKMLTNMGRGAGRLLPKELQDAVTALDPIIPRSQGHYKEWADACKGGKPAGSNFDFAGPLAEVVLLGNVALRPQLREQLVKHKLLWDPEKLEITNLPDANKFLRREYRKGWKSSRRSFGGASSPSPEPLNERQRFRARLPTWARIPSPITHHSSLKTWVPIPFAHALSCA